MLALIAIWALVEATFFFIVADVPIMALGIKAGWRKALVGAAVASVLAAIGGTALTIWAAANPAAAYEWMLVVPAIDAAMIDQVEASLEEFGLLSMVIGSVTGVPYKLYAFAASSYPQGLSSAALFFIFSIIARLPRFAMAAILAGLVGPALRDRFGAAPVWAVFASLWTAFYAWYWSVMGF